MVITQYRARTPIFTSRGEFRSPYDSRVYFWRDRWYNVFRLSKPRNDLSLWYCNVTTPLTVQPGQLNYVDLDLDVTVQPDGDIQLLDCDEFELHQKLYDYPPEITQRAEEAADRRLQDVKEASAAQLLLLTAAVTQVGHHLRCDLAQSGGRPPPWRRRKNAARFRRQCRA